MRRISLPAATIFSSVLAVFVLGISAFAQPAVVIPAAGDVTDLLDRGRQMEGQRRWGEALTCYEDAMRQFPGDGSLKSHFTTARLHYDLGRRYNDRSFRELLDGISARDALDQYNEVLLKIQTHYVDGPRWRELVDSGTAGLEVAMSEPLVLERCAPGITPRALAGFRDTLRPMLASRTIESRSDARDAVAMASGLAERNLGISAGTVAMEYMCAAASSLDPYSTYLTPDQLNEVYSQIEGNFVGLGVELKAQDGTLVILHVIPNSPAKRAGILDRDRIVAVNGQPVANVSADRAANLLQGPPDSVVELTVTTADGPSRRVSVRRERIEVPSVDEIQVLPNTQGVAYLKLTCFQKTTYRDFENALWTLHRAGMRSLIVDLRGNPGGLLVAAVEVADLFIDRGVIVSTHGRSPQEDFTYSAREPGTWHMPLVVLIDQDSASAAEILAGAIRDHHRGTIIGRRSYGKGSVQGIFPLSGGKAGIRLTTAKFFSPNGYPYAGVGVQPQIVVHQAAKPIPGAAGGAAGPQQDPVLTAALQAAQEPVASR